MVGQGLDIAIRYLLLTSMMVVSAKVGYIMLNRFRRYAERMAYRRKKPILTKLYKDVNAYQISVNHRRDTKLEGDHFIYGEIIFSSFADMLNVVKPKPGEIFYDLGCGSGRAVFTAALLYDYLDVRGIEYLTPLYDLCIELSTKFKSLVRKNHPNNITFINADLLTYDFTDADILFINATCFNDKQWTQLTEMLNKLKKGSRAIIASKKLHNKQFEMIHSGTYLMSWGQNSTFIYIKK